MISLDGIDLSQFGHGTARVAFGRDLGGSVTSLHLDLIPFSLEKRPRRENPRRWTGVGVTALAAVAPPGRQHWPRWSGAILLQDAPVAAATRIAADPPGPPAPAS